MGDPSKCDHYTEHRVHSTELTPDGATDRVRCLQCGVEWTWERSLTMGESVAVMKRLLREVFDEILRSLGLDRGDPDGDQD